MSRPRIFDGAGWKKKKIDSTEAACAWNIDVGLQYWTGWRGVGLRSDLHLMEDRGTAEGFLAARKYGNG